MNFVLPIFIMIIPSISAIVDCRTACRTCREKKEEASLLEVHCSMCEECKDRRRERVLLRQQTTETDIMQPNINVLDSVEQPEQEGGDFENCPTPPLCPDSVEYITVRTTLITTQTPCPPITVCRKKKRKTQATPRNPTHRTTTSPCYCMPYPMTGAQCPCPMPPIMPIQQMPAIMPVPQMPPFMPMQQVPPMMPMPQMSQMPQMPMATTTVKPFVDIFVGVPKNAMRIP